MVTYICHGLNTSEAIWPRPYDKAEATIVAVPFIEFQIETRSGCSIRRYHCAVRMVNRGIHPASKRPSKKRTVTKPAKLLHAAVLAAAIPQQRTMDGIKIRGGTFTMSHAENGCHASCAIGAMDETREYWLPTRPVSFSRLKTEAVPRTPLSKT